MGLIMKTIFRNGKIYTMKNQETVNNPLKAMLVKGNYILDLGTEQYIMGKYLNNKCRVVDLRKKTVIPGFNDAHLHIYQYALSNSKIRLNGVTGIEDISRRIKNYIKDRSIVPGKWIEGSGWNDKDFTTPGLPEKEELDLIAPENPLILKRACYHVALVNTRALDICQIDKKTPDPAGGKIKRDNQGSPTGVLYDDAIDLVENKIPQKNIKQTKELLQQGFEAAARTGLSSLQTDDFLNIKDPSIILQAYQELAEENKLPLRINLQLRVNQAEEIIKFSRQGIKTGRGNIFFKYGPIKIIADGSLGACTAALRQPYFNKSTKGDLLLSQTDLDRLVSTAYKEDCQVAVHAIGDAAVEMAANSFSRIKTINNPRPIIVHAQLGSPSIYQKMARNKVIAAVQPIFLATDWPIIEDRVGTDRSFHSYAWQSMQQSGIKICGSSDAPIEPFNPLYGIYAAVTRQDLAGNPQGGWHPAEQLSVYDAVKIFTVNPAYQSFEEGIKGTLEIGKLADFTVLSEDIFHLDREKIKDITILGTYVGGKAVYKS
ncbi:MAG: amidohydrolase [Firmicutes bacterium]|nr:amidohydrolase [Bacillota bacterium]